MKGEELASFILRTIKNNSPEVATIIIMEELAEILEKSQ
jgi:hypothetical protein